jgi:hypothetical protein
VAIEGRGPIIRVILSYFVQRRDKNPRKTETNSVRSVVLLMKPFYNANNYFCERYLQNPLTVKILQGITKLALVFITLKEVPMRFLYIKF